MRVRRLEERDRALVAAWDAAWRPDAAIELVFVDDQDRAVMVAGAYRIAEVHVAADADWLTPRWRLEALESLHEAMRQELEQAGFVEVVTWFDVGVAARGFGRALVRRLVRDFGWIESKRVSLHRGVRRWA